MRPSTLCLSLNFCSNYHFFFVDFTECHSPASATKLSLIDFGVFAVPTERANHVLCEQTNLVNSSARSPVY